MSSITRLCALQKVAVVRLPRTFFHPWKLTPSKSTSSPRKNDFYKKLHAIDFKNLQCPPLRTKKCLWRDSRASFAAPRPRPLVPMSLKLLHDLGFLGQASLKHQGHLHLVTQDHFWSFFTPLNQESHPYIRKTTLFLKKSRFLIPFYPSKSGFGTSPGGPDLDHFGRPASQEWLLKYNTFAPGTQKCAPGDYGGDFFV